VKWLRVANRHLASGVLGAIAGVSSVWVYGAKGQRGEHLTYQGLVGLPVGASGGEVIGQIGYPVAITPSGGTKMAPLGQSEPWPEGYVWVYANPNRWFLNEGLAVYVNMHDGRVASLYAKYNDMPIFWRSATGQRQNDDELKRLENELMK
jgi:hypothetical protein